MGTGVRQKGAAAGTQVTALKHGYSSSVVGDLGRQGYVTPQHRHPHSTRGGGWEAECRTTCWQRGPSRECPPLGMLMSSGDSSVLTRGRQDTLCQVSLFRPRTGWPGKPGGAYPSCRLGRHIILSVPSSITGSTYITLCLQEIMI